MQQHIHDNNDEKLSTAAKNSPPKNNNITLDVNPRRHDHQKSIIFQPNSYCFDGLQKSANRKKISNQKEVLSSKQSTHVEDQHIEHNEEEHDFKNLQNLHNLVNEKKNFHLSFISEIFDTFEASMRATPTSSEFVYCLINLHQSNKSRHTTELNQRDHPSCQSGPTIKQLLQHIQTLQKSFMKFAYSCKAFSHLLHTDQKELLKRNGLMFVMVFI